MRCEKGAITENLKDIAHYLTEAGARQVDLVGFPEMCLTGYTNPISHPETQLTLDGPEVSQLLKLTEGFAGLVLMGLIEANPGHKPFITHVVIHQGKLIGHYRKLTIQDEEVEWFSPGHVVPV